MTNSWVARGINDFAVEPGIYTFEEDDHQFKLGLVGFEVGAEAA